MLTLSGCKKADPPHHALPSPLVEIIELAESSPDPIVRWGVVEPSARRRLAFNVGGRVARVNARAGDAIRRGDTIATLRDREARTQLRAARVVEARALGEANTSNALSQSGSLSSRQSELMAADWQIAIARRDSAAELVAEMRLVAPADGVVRESLVEPGESVAPGQTVFLVEDGSRETITVGLTHRDVTRLRESAPVEVSTTAPSRTVTGRIARLAPSPNQDDGLFKVEIELGAEARLPPGTVVSVAFSVAEARELRVPSDAIVRRRGESYVARVTTDARVHLGRVRVAGFDGSEAVVVAGLAVGDRIVAEGGYFLFDGQSVRVLETGRATP